LANKNIFGNKNESQMSTVFWFCFFYIWLHIAYMSMPTDSSG